MILMRIWMRLLRSAVNLIRCRLMIFDGSFRAAMARLTAFRRSKRANVAMIFALSAIPVVIAVGGGVDLARSMVVRSNLASALDAAGLAVGPHPGSLRRRWRRSRSNILLQITRMQHPSAYRVPSALAPESLGPAL